MPVLQGVEGGSEEAGGMTMADERSDLEERLASKSVDWECDDPEGAALLLKAGDAIRGLRRAMVELLEDGAIPGTEWAYPSPGVMERAKAELKKLEG